MSHNNAHGYEFGPYRLDLGQRVLTRAGEKVALTPKATEILALLVSNAGQLVEKDALVNHIWRDTFVEESNLTQNVFLLRRALGDERPAPKYIETVARRGYRFVASVRPIGEDGRATNGEQGENTPRTIAVLPFINVTRDPDAEYLADGLTESLVNNLSRVSKLRVMSRSAVFRYKKKELDPRVIGKELAVDVVLVGKITSRPPGIGIGVELVDVGSGWQLYGESFEGELKDLLEIQDAITRQLLGALKLKLSGDEEKRVTARYTENAEAYQSYLEGRYHWSQYTRKGIEKAILHFRHAIELDPNYALAYAGIIDCYLRLTTNYLPPEGDLPAAPAEKSGSKSPRRRASKKPTKRSKKVVDDIEARVKLRFEWDWKVAEREFNRALELRYDQPTAHQWYAAYRLAKSLFERATGCSETESI
ncbi:MAG TPA: winged helix-turn-helix domain-containing protein, partial [Pyrinomonadaceae bacterium]|nr:winged helix-turn-helix domain-containing protein [Pyrinomonadaceae bacterium]